MLLFVIIKKGLNKLMRKPFKPKKTKNYYTNAKKAVIVAASNLGLRVTSVDIPVKV